MRTNLSRVCSQVNVSSTKPYSPKVHARIALLASQFSQPRTFTTSPPTNINIPFLNSTPKNVIHPSIRRPADLHTLLQSASSTNTLLLTLFKTSTCRSCSTITPLLSDLITNRPCPGPGDKFSNIAFAELELDSPERDEGGGRGWVTMYDVGIEYGVRSVPTLIGFGGRRAQRVTDRLADERFLSDKGRMENWISDVMRKGDEFAVGGLFGGGSG